MPNDEWYTPAPYVEAARAVLGRIDLDPASCEIAQRTVRAGRFYTERDNGLLLPWGTIAAPQTCWFNPPYSRGMMLPWTNRLMGAYHGGTVSAAILLCNACTSDGWFQPLYRYPICFTDHRIAFLDSNGVPQRSPRYSNAFVYFGPDPAAFARVFGAFGAIMVRYGSEVPA